MTQRPHRDGWARSRTPAPRAPNPHSFKRQPQRRGNPPSRTVAPTSARRHPTAPDPARCPPDWLFIRGPTIRETVRSSLPRGPNQLLLIPPRDWDVGFGAPGQSPSSAGEGGLHPGPVSPPRALSSSPLLLLRNSAGGQHDPKTCGEMTAHCHWAAAPRGVNGPSPRPGQTSAPL